MTGASTAAARMGSGLGWFSLALGLAELLRPGMVTRLAGVAYSPRLVRGLGLRELGSGAGILLRPNRPGWLWSRVAGDALDLALLGLASRSTRSNRLAMATAAVAGIAVLDMLAAYEQSRLRQAGGTATAGATDAIRIRKSLSINHSPEACYRFWRDIENFPRFMKHVDEVRMLDATRSRWKVHAPLGTQVEWTAELTTDVPAQQIGWRTLPGSGIDHVGAVHFQPATGGRGTQVTVDLSYRPPLGRAGSAVARLFGEEPSQQIDDDLRRFKQLIETGEIPTTMGQPAGRRSILGRALRHGAPG